MMWVDPKTSLARIRLIQGILRAEVTFRPYRLAQKLWVTFQSEEILTKSTM